MRKRSGQVHSRESSATLQLTVSLLYLSSVILLPKGYGYVITILKVGNSFLQKKFSIYFKEVTEDDCV